MYNSNKKPSAQILIFSFLAAFVLVFGTAAPALANEFVTDGDFSSNPFSGLWNNTGTKSWTWDGSKINATTNGSQFAYAWQCITVAAAPAGGDFKASASFLAAGGNVQVWFFDGVVCDINGANYDAILLTQAAPSVSSYTPMIDGTPTTPTSILVLATCLPSSSCSVDNISVDGADGTAVTLASLKASQQKPWTVLALTSAVLTIALLAFWQVRKTA